MVDSSPRPIAASHVLHRLLMPRHPPCALKHLFTTRCSHPLCNTQHTTTPQPHRPPPPQPRGALDGQSRGPKDTPRTGVSPQDPTACRTRRPEDHHHHEPIVMFHPATPTNNEAGVESRKRRTKTRAAPPTRKPATPQRAGQPHHTVRLLRKEVIQPHLPVRLPCYDFVPIADPTFDGSLPRGVRPPASGVTDFHDVTGGVYKARERIHRSVADLRLLATPTSRGRVADPDPN